MPREMAYAYKQDHPLEKRAAEAARIREKSTKYPNNATQARGQAQPRSPKVSDRRVVRAGRLGSQASKPHVLYDSMMVNLMFALALL